MKILIDALYINDGGGRILLDYLVEELEKTELNVCYLLDDRINPAAYNIKPTNSTVFSKAGLLERRNFYKKNKKEFSTVLCFANLPPYINYGLGKAKVYTYFHQTLFLNIPSDLSFFEKAKYWLKTKVVSSIRKNTDYWLVQSDLIKSKLAKKYKIELGRILVLPFYRSLPVVDGTIIRESSTYLYVSNATPHKNHIKLIEAFCKFYDCHEVGKLILTVQESAQEVYTLIGEKVKKGYPIENIGFVERSYLAQVYKRSQYLIFPSLAESLGLGLVEAIENGCNVIGADLPYTYAVCEPSITFNPHSTDSIFQALSLSLQSEIPHSKVKIKNNIKEIINLLK